MKKLPLPLALGVASICVMIDCVIWGATLGTVAAIWAAKKIERRFK